MNLSDAFDDLLSPLPPVPGLSPAAVARGRRRRQVKLLAAGSGGALALAAAVALALPSDPPVRDSVAPIAGPSSSPPTAPPTAAAAPVLVLEAGGLGYLRGPSSIGRITFAETSATEAQRVVSLAFGPGMPSPLPDCGAEVVQVAYDGGFVLTLDGDRWVGWSSTARPGSRVLRTADGIGLLSTLADLRDAYPDLQVTTGTVGVEWTPSGEGAPEVLTGSLSGTQPSSTVTRIASGSTCVFR